MKRITSFDAAKLLMPTELLLRRLLSPLADASIVDGALRDVTGLREASQREAFGRVVAARTRATDANKALVECLRAHPEEYLAAPVKTKTRGGGSQTRKKDAARAAIAVTDRLVAKTAVGMTSSSFSSNDGRYSDGGKWAVQGTLKGTSTRTEDLKVRFWNLWGGSKRCRDVMTKSDRKSVYRTPERLELAVLRLDEVAPFLDAPLLLHGAPELLAYDTDEIVRRLVKMKEVFPSGDVGFVCTGTPELLLIEPASLKRAVRTFAKEQGPSGSSALASSVAELVKTQGIEVLRAYDREREAVDEVESVVTTA